MVRTTTIAVEGEMVAEEGIMAVEVEIVNNNNNRRLRRENVSRVIKLDTFHKTALINQHNGASSARRVLTAIKRADIRRLRHRLQNK